MFALDTIVVDGRPTLAIAAGGHHVPLAAAGARLGMAIPEAPLIDHLRAWTERWPVIDAIARNLPRELAIRDARSIPQLSAARKVICAGANYYKHLAEMDVTFVKDAAKAPFMFLKPPTALDGPLRLDSPMLDWEVELVAVIGRGGRDIAFDVALDHVAAYTVAVDVTARDRLFQPESIFKFDFVAGKGQDGYCPTATAVVPAAFVTPTDAHLRLAVNGVTKQDASTADMIYSVAELVTWASRRMTLEPGDLLLTGSPEGVGFPRREFLARGDVMHVELVPHLAFDVEVT